MKRTLSVLLAALLLLPGARSVPAQEPCGAWNPAALPSPAAKGLASVSASSAADVWAVWKALYHWDGSAWSLVPAPGLGSPDTVYVAVAAVAPGDAWMVGYVSFFGNPQTLVARWDGVAWSVIPSPVIAGGSELDAVDALSANDAWVVGSRAGGHPEFAASRVTLTAHWNGSAWTAVASPNVSNRSHELLDVEVIAPDDVWAVGSFRNIGEDYQTLILHWDGALWSVVPSPNLPGENILHGVSASATDDVWAVGGAWDGVTWRQVFLHWDGATWRQVDGPGGPTECAACTGDVLALGPADVWAVGNSIGHWDGTRWSLVPEPANPAAGGRALRGLAGIGPCDAWAVGSRFDADGAEEALALHLTAGSGPPVAVEGDAEGSGLALRAGPNPARGEMHLALRLPAAGVVRVAVHDPSGRLVREVLSAALPAGWHHVRWDGRDAAGRPAGAGIYFATATAGTQRVSTRLLRLR